MKSIWDGWEKQFRFTQPLKLLGGTVSEGFDCALTWAMKDCYLSEATGPTIQRVATYIKAHYVVPDDRRHQSDIIVYANNILGLTPDDFRRIDLLTQQEAAGMPAVEALVESVEVGVAR